VGCSARVLGEQDVEVGGSSVDGVRDVGERDVEVSDSIVVGVCEIARVTTDAVVSGLLLHHEVSVLDGGGA
jgi:hypothetical protein